MNVAKSVDNCSNDAQSTDPDIKYLHDMIDNVWKISTSKYSEQILGFFKNV